MTPKDFTSINLTLKEKTGLSQIQDILSQYTATEILRILESVGVLGPKETLQNNYISPKLLSQGSQLEGMGVFVKEGETIQTGELLAIFGGKNHSLQEAIALPDNLFLRHLLVNPGFTLGPRSQKEADAGDNFNHSCDPNAGIEGQISLYALKGIQGGEEVTFDYGTVFGGLDIERLTFPESIEQMIDRETGMVTLFPECLCGSPYCRGTVTSEDWKVLKSIPLLLGHFTSHIQRLINNT